MKHAWKLVLMLFASVALASCVSTPSGKGPVLRLPDARLLADCVYPVLLPDGGMTQLQIEHYWMKDRAGLVACGLSKKAVQDFYRQRDNRLART